MKPSDFVHLHVHSDYSLIDGAAKTKALAEQAKRSGHIALALTDHGSVSGIIDHWKACEKNGVKPIIGCEAYLAPGLDDLAHTRRGFDADGAPILNEKGKKKSFDYSHFTLLAKNEVGWRNLQRLATIASLDGFYYRPRMSWALLTKYHEGLIALSGCLSGQPAREIRKGNDALAEAHARRWLSLFGSDYYMEMMPSSQIPEQVLVNDRCLAIAKRLGIKPVATGDVHYVDPSEADVQEVKICVNAYKTMAENRASGLCMPATFYYKSTEEMYSEFSQLPEAILNTREVADKCEKIKVLPGKFFMPKFHPPTGEAPVDYFRRLAREGLFGRYGIPTEEQTARLEYELACIEKLGFVDYFLVVHDFITWARKNGVHVGPGRGCLGGESRVVLENGSTKPISDVLVGDVVRSHTGVAREVLNLHRYPISEPLVRIMCFYGDDPGVALTKDHLVLAVKHARPSAWATQSDSTRHARKSWERPSERPTWIPAGGIEIGDWVFVPTPEVSARRPNDIDLAAFAGPNDVVTKSHVVSTRGQNNSFKFSVRDVSAATGVARNSIGFILSGAKLRKANPRNASAALRVKKYISSRFTSITAWKKWLTTATVVETRVKRRVRISRDFLKIVGYWVANGWLRYDSDLVFGLAFHSDATDKIATTIRFFESLGLESHVAKSATRKLVQIVVRSRALVSYWKSIIPEYRSTARTKRFPDFVMDLPTTDVRTVLSGYLGCDGSFGENKITATTVSRRLADQVRFLGWRCGLPSSVRHVVRYDQRFNKSFESYVLTMAKDHRLGGDIRQAEYRWHPASDGMLLQVRSVQDITGQREVFDLTVAEDHAYQTSSFSVHNSAAGSLASYCLWITNIDPLRYDLLFERFLNPDRVSMPDIDIDFDERGRGRVIEYVKQKYGEKAVAQIVTFGESKAKSAVKDVARVLEVSQADANRLTKMIPEGPKVELKESLETIPELALAYQDPRNKRLFDLALGLEGLYRNCGRHAAGIVIGDTDLIERIPLMRVGKGEDAGICTAFSMEQVEEVGLIKMDFLGLRTITQIHDTLELIEETTGKRIDEDKIPLRDAHNMLETAGKHRCWIHEVPFSVCRCCDKALQVLCTAETNGVFQVESSGMKKLLKQMKPDRFDDIIALVALFRPGPLGSGMDQTYVRRKNGEEPVEYEHPSLKSITHKTYGVWCFQEQLMQLSVALAGFTLPQADELRKATAKKKPEAMAKIKDKFIPGCVKHVGMPVEQATAIWEKIVYFSEYSFNCIAGDSEVVCADTGEVVSVESLAASGRRPLVHALGDDFKVRRRQIKCVWSTGKQAVFEMDTASHRKVKATAKHRFRTLDGWRELADLRPGDMIAVAREMATTGDLSMKHHETHDGVPASVRSVVDDARASAGMTWDELEAKSGVSMREMYRKASPKKMFGRYTIDAVASVLPDAKLQDIAGRDVFWDTVKSITPAGVHDTYDMEVEGDHNFAVNNGIIAHNCSHSAAYGMIGWNTAWLKANYPVEFMAALMTCWSGVTDDLARYVEEVRRWGVPVESPDINEGVAKFKVRVGPDGTKSIIYGLEALKGISGESVNAIISARKRVGRFRSFLHFAENIDTTVITTGVMETLAKAGAFLSTGVKRSQLLEPVDRTISSKRSSKVVTESAIATSLRLGKAVQKDAASGQGMLFAQELSDEDEERVVGDLLPVIPEWKPSKILAAEKEALGLYLSGHPLDEHAEALHEYVSAWSVRSGLTQSVESVVMGGVVRSLRRTLDRSGNEMAFATVEDIYGLIDAVFFGSSWQENRSKIAAGRVLFLKGKLDRERDPPSLRVEKVIPLDQAAFDKDLAGSSGVMIRFFKERVKPTHIQRVREIIDKNPGPYSAFYQMVSCQTGELFIERRYPTTVNGSPAIRRNIADALLDAGSVERFTY